MYVTEGDVRKIIIVLWMALCVIVPADLLRFNSKRFERTYERYLGFLMRESEKVRNWSIVPDSLLTLAAEWHKWRCLVYLRCQLRAFIIPSRCRDSGDSDVSLHSSLFFLPSLSFFESVCFGVRGSENSVWASQIPGYPDFLK
jgi:hypothetical protein